MIDLCNVCKACKNSYLITTNGTCGLPTCGAVNSFKDFSPRENRGEKTLLDEFATAAMAAIIGKNKPETVHADEWLTEYRTAIGAYDYAAAMMQERNRRDEMGNEKEATEQ